MPAYSPWVRGTVERINQTLKHKLIARMYQHKTTRWTQFVRDVTDEYNNTQHSTTQMIPTEAWKRCWRASLSDETLEQLRDNIWAGGESERQAYLKKNPHIPQFRVGDIVLVRVPRKYRTAQTYLFGRNATVVEEQFAPDGQHHYRYKVKWAETGGIKRSELQGHHSTYYIDARDLKSFYHVDHVRTEPARDIVDCDDSDRIQC